MERVAPFLRAPQVGGAEEDAVSGADGYHAASAEGKVILCLARTHRTEVSRFLYYHHGKLLRAYLCCTITLYLYALTTCISVPLAVYYI